MVVPTDCAVAALEAQIAAQKEALLQLKLRGLREELGQAQRQVLSAPAAARPELNELKRVTRRGAAVMVEVWIAAITQHLQLFPKYHERKVWYGYFEYER